MTGTYNFRNRFLLICLSWLGLTVWADDLQSIIKLGEEHYLSGKYAQAVEQFQQLTDQDYQKLSRHQQEQLNFNLACSYAQQEQWQLALEYFQKVLGLNSKHQRALKNIEIIKKLLEQQSSEQKQKTDQQDKSKDNPKNDQKSEQSPSSQDNQSKSQAEGTAGAPELNQKEQEYLQAVQELDRQVRSSNLRQVKQINQANSEDEHGW